VDAARRLDRRSPGSRRAGSDRRRRRQRQRRLRRSSGGTRRLRPRRLAPLVRTGCATCDSVVGWRWHRPRGSRLITRLQPLPGCRPTRDADRSIGSRAPCSSSRRPHGGRAGRCLRAWRRRPTRARACRAAASRTSHNLERFHGRGHRSDRLAPSAVAGSPLRSRPSPPTIRTVLFDLDGTLIDRCSSFSRATGTPCDAWTAAPERRRVAQWRRHAPQGPVCGLAGRPRMMEALIATYRDYNLANHDRMVRVFPACGRGARAPERACRWDWSPARRARGAARITAGGPGGGDGRAGLRRRGHQCQATPGAVPPRYDSSSRPLSTVYVGDSIHRPALRSGRRRAHGGRTLGPFTRQQLEPGEPDFWLEHPSELLRLLD